VSASLPAAKATGNMSLRPHSVVHSIIYEANKKRAAGVRVIDARTHEVTEYFAKIIFLNAGTINSTLILFNSTSPQFPDGLGNTNDVLGRYLMDHNYRAHMGGEHDGFQEQYYYGRRPTGIYIPRFRNVGDDVQKDFIRGFAIAAGGSRGSGTDYDAPIGAELKEQLSEAGPWNMWMTGMGECLPYAENRITINKDKKDAWGMPTVEIDCEYKQNEISMLKDIMTTGSEMLEKAGFKNIYASDGKSAPGLGIHEMGTARMGKDPKTSILNASNQIWDVQNVFVTDGSCMASNACQNPSITYMALTARAADYAVSELKRGNI
jgi:choline dehydrogenase-like flavoprotein